MILKAFCCFEKLCNLAMFGITPGTYKAPKPDTEIVTQSLISSC